MEIPNTDSEVESSNQLTLVFILCFSHFRECTVKALEVLQSWKSFKVTQVQWSLLYSLCYWRAKTNCRGLNWSSKRCRRAQDGPCISAEWMSLWFLLLYCSGISESSTSSHWNIRIFYCWLGRTLGQNLPAWQEKVSDTQHAKGTAIYQRSNPEQCTAPAWTQSHCLTFRVWTRVDEQRRNSGRQVGF